MKNILISILSIFFIFACSSTPVEKVDVQETKTVDLTATKQKDTDNEVALNNVEVGEAYVTILFDYDDDTLKEESLEELFTISRLMKADSMYTLLVEGHADERGTREYNLALGERRANAAKDYLMTYGISSSRVSVLSYGKERPVDSGSNPLAWSKNRRSVTVKAN